MIRIMFQKMAWLVVVLVLLSVLTFAATVVDELECFNDLLAIGEPDWAFVESFKAHYGLEESAYMRYFLWVRQWMQGDWGQSLWWNQPVRDVALLYLRQTLTVSIPLIMLFFGLAFVGWGRLGTQDRISRCFLPFTASLRAIPMFLWALALMMLVVHFLDFRPTWPFTFVNGSVVWNLPYSLNALAFFVIPVLVLGMTILMEFSSARQHWFEDAHDDLEAFRAKGLSGKAARKDWRRLALPQFVYALRDFLPDLASELLLLSVVVSWPTLGVRFAGALLHGDPRLAGAILFIITGGVAVGVFLLDVWEVWLRRCAVT